MHTPDPLLVHRHPYTLLTPRHPYTRPAAAIHTLTHFESNRHPHTTHGTAFDSDKLMTTLFTAPPSAVVTPRVAAFSLAALLIVVHTAWMYKGYANMHPPQVSRILVAFSKTLDFDFDGIDHMRRRLMQALMTNVKYRPSVQWNAMLSEVDNLADPAHRKPYAKLFPNPNALSDSAYAITTQEFKSRRTVYRYFAKLDLRRVQRAMLDEYESVFGYLDAFGNKPPEDCLGWVDFLSLSTPSNRSPTACGAACCKHQRSRVMGYAAKMNSSHPQSYHREPWTLL